MHYVIETEINQPRDKVVELFDNPDNLAFWQPGFVSFTHESGEAGTPGAKSRIKYRHGNREFEMLETVTVRNLPEEFSGEFEVPGMFTVEIKNFFRELGPGKTMLRAEDTVKWTGWLMKIMSVIMGPCTKRESKKFMDNFKAFAETGADVRKTGD